MDEYEIFPGIGEFDSERLADLGFSKVDVGRMVAAIEVDTMVGIAADDAIDEAFETIVAEVGAVIDADEAIKVAAIMIEAEQASVMKSAEDVIDEASVVIEAENILGDGLD